MARVIFDSEKELEDFICKSLDMGFCPVTNADVTMYLRQLNLGRYGVADIVKIKLNADKSILITIMELKKEIVDMPCIAQVMRYHDGLRHFIDEYLPDYSDQIEIICEVAAPKLSLGGDTVFLLNNINNLSAYIIECSLDQGFFGIGAGSGYTKDQPAFADSPAVIDSLIMLMEGGDR